MTLGSVMTPMTRSSAPHRGHKSGLWSSREAYIDLDARVADEESGYPLRNIVALG